MLSLQEVEAIMTFAWIQLVAGTFFFVAGLIGLVRTVISGVATFGARGFSAPVERKYMPGTYYFTMVMNVVIVAFCGWVAYSAASRIFGLPPLPSLPIPH